MKKIWKTISFIGLENLEINTALYNFRDVILINRLVFILGFILTLYLPVEIIFHGTGLVPIILVEMGLVLFTLVWNKRKKFLLSKIYFFLSSLLAIVPMLFYTPREVGNQYFLLPISLIPVLFFKKKWQSAVGFIFVVCVFYFVEYSRDFVPDIIDLPIKTIYFFSHVFILMVFIILYLLIYYFKAINDDYEAIIKKQNFELKSSQDVIGQKNKEITDSINYAKRIQSALFASDLLLKKNLPGYFVLFKPKDIVSGDFYWARNIRSQEVQFPDSHESSYPALSVKAAKDPGAFEQNSRQPAGAFYLAVADCTGHGVPGAFMSLLNISLLKESVVEKKQYQPDIILNEVRKEIITALNPDGKEDGKDGMDCVLCVFDFERNILKFSCANNPLWLVRNNKLTEFSPDKMPVGMQAGVNMNFTLQTLHLQKDDVIYLCSDGYADQFGGPKGKKFKYKQLEDLLLSIHQKPMDEQKRILNDIVEKWKGNLEQVDDITIIGVHF